MAARGMAAGDKSIVNMDIMASIASMDIRSIGNHVIVSTSTTDTTDIRNPSNMEVKNNNTAHNINNLKNNSNTEHKSSTVNNKSQKFSKKFTNQI
jgi:hypothetical protein